MEEFVHIPTGDSLDYSHNFRYTESERGNLEQQKIMHDDTQDSAVNSNNFLSPNMEGSHLIKLEPTVDDEEETSSDESTSLSAQEDMVLPLDVQISEAEVENDERVELEIKELPVKTELIEWKEESIPHEIMGETNSNINLKVEPLEESFEDRMNDFVNLATQGSSPSNCENIGPINCDEIENEDESGHFIVSQVREKRRSKGGSLQCVKCSARFKYQSTYDYHVKSACGTKMIARNQLVKKSGKNQVFECNVCQKKLCSRTSLMVHMRIHNGERPFSCDICSRSFFQKAHLKDHIKTHMDGKPTNPLFYTCAECGNVYPNKTLLTSHLNVHFGDKIFDCNICHKRFRTRSNLSNHKMIHGGRKPHCCKICGKEFLRKPSLNDHIRTHTKEKPFECHICGKRFAEKTRRNNHVKRHTGELRQVCGTCGKKFACSYDLRVHQRMHTGEKPFSCNICGRMFNRKAVMETHMTIHTGRKDFVCVECGEAFNRKSKLQVHLTTHTGEQFVCEICHRVFKCKAYLVPHVRTHFNEGKQRGKKCKCLVCSAQFPNKKLLQEHLASAHTSLFNPPVLPIAFVKVETDQ